MSTPMKCPSCKAEFPNPEKVKGGQKSRRVLTREQALAMVAARRRMARRFTLTVRASFDCIRWLDFA